MTSASMYADVIMNTKKMQVLTLGSGMAAKTRLHNR